MVAARARHAGPMSHRARFERAVQGDDGLGNVITAGWAELFTCWAYARPETGREALQAGRLESSLRMVLAIDRFSGSAALTAADRIVITAGPYAGRVLNIRTIAPTADNRQIEIVAEEGVAT